MRVYGNHDLQSTLDNPLVTFALIAYNQEKFVCEAIEGAFAQTYSPLEIVLSDDFSKDNTFELMEKMASAYRGPHKVIVKRNRKNLRPYMHVLEVSESTSSELLIISAGDDVSKPCRVEKIVSNWKKSGAWALHSRYDVIDENGKIIFENTRTEELFSINNDFSKYFYANDGPVQIVHGATSAYDMRLIRLALKEDRGILSEDGVFSILLNIAGGTATFIDESLVLYRKHEGAISNFERESGAISLNKCVDILRKEASYSKNIAARSELAINLIDQMLPARRVNKSALLEDRDFHQARADWSGLTYKDRIRAIRVAVRRRQIGFLISAIFGESIGAIYLAVRLLSRRKAK